MSVPTSFVCTKIYSEEEQRKICRQFTSDDYDPTESHHDNAKEDLKNVIALGNGRVATKIDLISEQCGEIYPCVGHDGVNISYSDGSSSRYKCSSFSIGCITSYYKHLFKDNITVNPHCDTMVRASFKKHLLDTFNY